MTVFLSAVQSDRFMFHRPRWSVTKSFRHQPRNRRGNLNTLLSTQWYNKPEKLHENQQPNKATQQQEAGHSKLITEKKKLHDISRWLWLKYWKCSKTCGQTSYIVKPVSHICYIWLTVERFMYYFKWYILLTNSENMPFLQNMMTSCILCQSYWLYKVQD